MSGYLERAAVLLRQSRNKAALEELSLAFAEDPEDPIAHGMASMAHLAEGNILRSRDHAESAIRSDPTEPIGHYALAQTFLAGNRFDEARRAATQALELDLEDINSYVLLATVELADKKYDAAVDIAEEGLLIDPDSPGCMNVRAQALARRGDAPAAAASLDEALRQDPDDDDTHANLGWTLLHQGDHKRAKQHFAEALRLNPENAWARDGLVAALKAKNIIYRLALKWYLWVGSMSSGMQWALIIGLWLLFRFSRSISTEHPQLAPWILPLQILYGAFCALTWLAEPVFDMMLLFDKQGRVALRPRAKRGAIAVTLMMAYALLNVGLSFVAGPWEGVGVIYAIVALLTCAPLYAAFSVAPGWPTVIAWLASLALISVQLIVLSLTIMIGLGNGDPELLMGLRSMLSLVGVYVGIAALWGSNFLHQAAPKT